jgi:hypothetical protein
MKQIEYYWALLSALIDNQYEIGVVSQRLAEYQRRNALGRLDIGAGPPYYTDQTSDRTGRHGIKEAFAVPVQTLWLEDRVCV